jgi:hypothetical protein
MEGCWGSSWASFLLSSVITRFRPRPFQSGTCPICYIIAIQNNPSAHVLDIVIPFPSYSLLLSFHSCLHSDVYISPKIHPSISFDLLITCMHWFLSASCVSLAYMIGITWTISITKKKKMDDWTSLTWFCNFHCLLFHWRTCVDFLFFFLEKTVSRCILASLYQGGDRAWSQVHAVFMCQFLLHGLHSWL